MGRPNKFVDDYKLICNMRRMEKSILHIAVEKLGSQSAFAQAVGTTQQSVSYWLNHGGKLPAEFVMAAEKATGIPRHELRPDIFREPAQ